MKCFYITEVALAWSTLEVFLLALIVGLFQIRQFVNFIFGPYCGGIVDTVIKALDKSGQIHLNGDDLCFDVGTILLNGSYVMIASAISYCIVGNFILRKCNNKIDEQIKRIINEKII